MSILGNFKSFVQKAPPPPAADRNFENQLQIELHHRLAADGWPSADVFAIETSDGRGVMVQIIYPAGYRCTNGMQEGRKTILQATQDYFAKRLGCTLSTGFVATETFIRFWIEKSPAALAHLSTGKPGIE